jgi:hypothetical protein
MSPQGRGIAGAVALVADIADIISNSDDIATDGTAKVIGEIAASSVSKKLSPLIDVVPIKKLKDSTGNYLKESFKEFTKDQVSSASEDFIKEKGQ